jgi:hypothetical protein
MVYYLDLILFYLMYIRAHVTCVQTGGLFSEDGVTLDQIRRIDRNQQPPDSGISIPISCYDYAH